MIGHLRVRPLVRAVHVSRSAGRLVVDHDHDSAAGLVAEIGDDLRGWELADNGERVVTLDVHEQRACPVPTAWRCEGGSKVGKGGGALERS